MNLTTKILNKAKAIFKRDSSRSEHPGENDFLESYAIVPDPLSGLPLEGRDYAWHARRPDSSQERNGRGIQTARHGYPGRGNNTMPTPSRLNREVENNILGGLDLERQTRNRQKTSNRQDVDSMKRVYEIRDINMPKAPQRMTQPDGTRITQLSTSDNRNRVHASPGPPLRGRIHARMPDSPGQHHGRALQTARNRRPGRADNTMPIPSHSNQERIIGKTQHMAENNISRTLDLERQSRDVISIHEIRDINMPKVHKTMIQPHTRIRQPSTSDNHNRRAIVPHIAAGENEDGQRHVPSVRPPIGHSPSRSIGFHNIKNSGISIGGGPVNVRNEIHNHNPSELIRPGLKFLHKRVATSAFHNSAQRVDPPRCHPDTRIAIQNQIYNWIVMDLLIRHVWIMWMHGAAGAGKSAIMQSIAEVCEKARIPIASFFFFRADPTRNSMVPFIATLVYQLIQKIPQIRNEILMIIENNPLILEESLESQLQQLIIQPLLRLQAHFKCYFVVIIDGLDECLKRAHQADLIKVLGTICCSRSTPVIFLVASRREPQIEAAFMCKQISNLVLTLPLDNSDIEQTSDDIRRFLVDKFRDIKETHLLKRYLPIDWPPASSVEEIMYKSSGQFIFASVVINYLSSPRANPARQLEVIRGMRLQDPSQNPFAYLDALYEHIFSQVEALEQVLDIIAFVILGNSYIPEIRGVFRLEDGELDFLFTDLTSVILCEPTSKSTYYPQLEFLHASLPDFLIDKTRSKQYHIDRDEYTTKLLCKFLQRCPIFHSLWTEDAMRTAINSEQDRMYAIEHLLKKAKPSKRLHSALMNFNCRFYNKAYFSNGWADITPNILSALKLLNFNDQGEAYRHVVDMFAVEYTQYCLSHGPGFTSKLAFSIPDVMARMPVQLEGVVCI